MKLSKTLILVFVCLLSMPSYAQKCKYNKKTKRIASKFFDHAIVEKSTKFQTLFSKFSTAAASNFVKTDQGYYLGLILNRELGARIDLMKDNPLMLQFENDKVVFLYPYKSVVGKFSLPVMNEHNKTYYTVTHEDLNLISSQPIRHIKIYFTIQKGIPKNNTARDDKGHFLNYEILKKSFQENCMNAAKCIAL